MINFDENENYNENRSHIQLSSNVIINTIY